MAIESLRGKYMLRFILSIFVMLSLVGCVVSPDTLGVSSAKWGQYSEAQQQELIANYEQIQGSTLGAPVDDNNYVYVNITGGTVMMSPFIIGYAYNPLEFMVTSGECKTVPLNSTLGVGFVDLTACFKNDILYMDPSRYELNKRFGSIQFHALPLWKQGFSYKNISSSGYARLQNVTVSVKQVVRQPSD